MYFPIHSLVDVLFFKFFKNEENLKKNTSTSGCIEKYISLVKMYKKIRNRKIELKKKIIIYTKDCGSSGMPRTLHCYQMSQEPIVDSARKSSGSTQLKALFIKV